MPRTPATVVMSRPAWYPTPAFRDWSIARGDGASTGAAASAAPLRSLASAYTLRRLPVPVSVRPSLRTKQKKPAIASLSIDPMFRTGCRQIEHRQQSYCRTSSPICPVSLDTDEKQEDPGSARELSSDDKKARWGAVSDCAHAERKPLSQVYSPRLLWAWGCRRPAAPHSGARSKGRKLKKNTHPEAGLLIAHQSSARLLAGVKPHPNSVSPPSPIWRAVACDLQPDQASREDDGFSMGLMLFCCAFAWTATYESTASEQVACMVAATQHANTS